MSDVKIQPTQLPQQDILTFKKMDTEEPKGEISEPEISSFRRREDLDAQGLSRDAKALIESVSPGDLILFSPRYTFNSAEKWLRVGGGSAVVWDGSYSPEKIQSATKSVSEYAINPHNAAFKHEDHLYLSFSIDSETQYFQMGANAVDPGFYLMPGTSKPSRVRLEIRQDNARGQTKASPPVVEAKLRENPRYTEEVQINAYYDFPELDAEVLEPISEVYFLEAMEKATYVDVNELDRAESPREIDALAILKMFLESN